MGDLPGETGFQRNVPVLQGPFERFHHDLRQCTDIHRLFPQRDIPVLEPGEIEDIVHQPGQPPAAVHDHGQIGTDPVRYLSRHTLYEGFRDADDAVQGGAQFMAGVGQKLVLELVQPGKGNVFMLQFFG